MSRTPGPSSQVQATLQILELVRTVAACDPALFRDDLSSLVPIAKFGSTLWNSFHTLISQIPGEWSPGIRKKLVKELWTNSLPIDELLPYLDFSTLPESNSATSQVLGPPVGRCMKCEVYLTLHNDPVSVRFMTIHGQILHKKKITLRCPTCYINYGFDKYGSRSKGYRFYEDSRDAIQGNGTTFMERSLYNLQCSLALHSWVSFEGFTESWHDAFSIPIGEEIDRRVIADIFWWGEVEQELRDLGCVKHRFKGQGSREECMRLIDQRRNEQLYPHPIEDCSEKCKERGCGKLWVTDGIWKTQFAHCMFNVSNYADGMPLLNLPEVCTKEPAPGKAFCFGHATSLEEEGTVPTKLKDFFKSIGENQTNHSEVNTSMVHLDHAYTDLTVDNGPESVISQQGGQVFLRDHAQALPAMTRLAETTSKSRCQKDLGERKTLRLMSRGHQFVVRAGGHIDMWTPLYQSESVGQVLLIIFSWLYLTLQDIPANQWSKLWLAYDNMCQLLRCKASQTTLPLPAPYDEMWQKINKIIDGLHIKNHVDVTCQTDLHPDNFNEMYPELEGKRNTQAGEQTFVWLSRFKKIVCSMPKVHHLFYLHRLVKRRNKYTVKCYKKNRQPLLPTLRNGKST